MNRRRNRHLVAALLCGLTFALSLLVVLIGPAAANAQSGGNYDLSWWAVDGGGNTLNTGGAYSLGGAAGQPDAGTWEGNGYTLAGGFWGGAGLPVAGDFYIYLPLVLKN
ncbi:MAG: hypothetical protein GY835_19310 [bacterium]|nr:hypothetical protein [bacterium]